MKAIILAGGVGTRLKPFANYESYKINNNLKLVDKTLNIPSGVNISNNEIKFVIEKLK